MDGYGMKHVYVILSNSGLVKIGVSQKPEKRIKSIEAASGFEIISKYITPKCGNSYEVESMIHSCFANSRKRGEWFDVNFNDAVIVASEIYQYYSSKTNKMKSDSMDFINKLIQMLSFKTPDKMFKDGFSDEFIDMAIELGEKMKEIKRLKYLVNE